MDVEITIPEQTVTIPSQSVDVTIPAAQIVYQTVIANQTSNISNMTVFTPSGNGLFRLTVTIFAQPIPGAITGVNGNVSYGEQSFPSFNASYGNGIQTSQTTEGIFAGVPSSSVILYASYAASGGLPPGPYDVWITIEQLQ